jgi:hypothetical protein
VTPSTHQEAARPYWRSDQSSMSRKSAHLAFSMVTCSGESPHMGSWPELHVAPMHAIVLVTNQTVACDQVSHEYQSSNLACWYALHVLLKTHSCAVFIARYQFNPRHLIEVVAVCFTGRVPQGNPYFCKYNNSRFGGGGGADYESMVFLNPAPGVDSQTISVRILMTRSRTMKTYVDLYRAAHGRFPYSTKKDPRANITSWYRHVRALHDRGATQHM